MNLDGVNQMIGGSLRTSVPDVRDLSEAFIEFVASPAQTICPRVDALEPLLIRMENEPGSIKINGVESIGLPTYKVAHLGVGYCPEERGIFSSLSAEENLLLLLAMQA